jgi:NTP pyrophosphatase (non-canonical NTP hydrolase)
MRTCNIPEDKKDDMLLHAIFGLNAEAGEAAGIFQKTYQEHPFDKEHLIKELGDCLWMIAEACTALDISLEDCMKTNIEKLRKRYPDGFSGERSLHRAEGDV